MTKTHPYAQLLPALTPDEYDALKASINERGQDAPIAILNGEILDGCHRAKACFSLGIEPKMVELPPDTDPLQYVLAHGFARRHLSVSQKAITAAKIWAEHLGELPLSKLAKIVGVSERSLDFATKTLKRGTPQILKAVEQDEVAVSLAAKIVEKPTTEQDRTLTQLRIATTKAAHTKPKSPTPKPAQRPLVAEDFEKLVQLLNETREEAQRLADLEPTDQRSLCKSQTMLAVVIQLNRANAALSKHISRSELPPARKQVTQSPTSGGWAPLTTPQWAKDLGVG